MISKTTVSAVDFRNTAGCMSFVVFAFKFQSIRVKKYKEEDFLQRIERTNC